MWPHCPDRPDGRVRRRYLAFATARTPSHAREEALVYPLGLRDRDGTEADGLITGYWDRPFEEAVDLMNAWLTR